MKIAIIGTGYVGLITGLCLGYGGHSVCCHDMDEKRMELLKNGHVPFHEPGTDRLLSEMLLANRIRFSSHLNEAVGQADAVIFCVGTPSTSSGEADLGPLWTAVREAAEHAPSDAMLVIKSTVPVGTCEKIAAYSRYSSGRMRSHFVVHNPEFLRQGSALYDALHPNRIVIGAEHAHIISKAEDMYRHLSAPVIRCGLREAELIKYASNAFLAMKISYANMLSDLCDSLGTNVDKVLEGVGTDSRIGSSHLSPGAGFGGSCFPKDLLALQSIGEAAHCELPLVEATLTINRKRTFRLLRKLKQALGELSGRKIALLGLTFKPDTDDLREAPSLAFSRLLLGENATVEAYDPVCRHFPVPSVRLHQEVYNAIEGCDAAVILTEWPEFRNLDWRLVHRVMKTPLVLDARNMLSYEQMETACKHFHIQYISVGRPDLLLDPIRSSDNEASSENTRSNWIDRLRTVISPAGI